MDAVLESVNELEAVDACTDLTRRAEGREPSEVPL